MRTAKFITVILLATAALASGCHRRPLDLTMSRGAAITVIAHWDSTGLRPNGMTVSFYPESGGNPITTLSNSDTVEVNLPEGEYNLLVFNETVSDFTNLRFYDVSNFNGIYAYTGSYSNKYYDNIRETPEKLASFTKPVTVSEDMVRYTLYYRRGTPPPQDVHASAEDLVIHVWPKLITCVINTRLHATHIDKAASAGGYLGHFAAGVYLASGKTLREDAIFAINFEQKDMTGATEGYFSNTSVGFGFYEDVFPPAVSGYSFDFFAVLADNSGYRNKMGIDDKISTHRGAFDELNIDIDIYPGAELPDVEGNQAWNIGVNEWENEEVPISL